MIGDAVPSIAKDSMIQKDRSGFLVVIIDMGILCSAIPKEKKIIAYIAQSEWQDEWIKLNLEFTERSMGPKENIEKDMAVIDLAMEIIMDIQLDWKIWGRGSK